MKAEKIVKTKLLHNTNSRNIEEIVIQIDTKQKMQNELRHVF